MHGAEKVISPTRGINEGYCIVLYCIVLYCIVLYCIIQLLVAATINIIIIIIIITQGNKKFQHMHFR